MASHDAVRLLQGEIARLKDENRELRDEISLLRTSLHALCSLQDLVSGLTPRTDVIKFLDEVLASALAVVGASDGSLLLLDEATGELAFAVVHGQARAALTGYRLPPGVGIAGWVAQNRKPVIVRDARQDPRFDSQVDEVFAFKTGSLACVPLLDVERVLGVIEAVNKSNEREFTSEDHDLLMLLAQVASLAIVRAERLSEQSPRS